MYDELVKSIHCCFGFDSMQTDCENCMMKDKREEHNYVGCCDALGLAAADAIEKLQEDNAALNGTVSNLIQQIEELRKDGWYLQKTKMMTYGQATMTMPLPEPPKEE